MTTVTHMPEGVHAAHVANVMAQRCVAERFAPIDFDRE